jgi:hypothetical protein
MMTQVADLRQELQRLTADAFLRAVDAEPRARAADRPRAGDLYALAACPEPGVEWLVVDIEDATDRVLVLPSDTIAWIGTGDVAVADETAAGPLCVRCALGVWLDRDAFRGARLSATIATFDLMRVRERQRQLLSAKFVPTDAEQEVDLDPDYYDWCRTLAGAREALCRSTRSAS